MSEELVVTCGACRAFAALEGELPAVQPAGEATGVDRVDPLLEAWVRGRPGPAAAARVRLEPFARRHLGHALAVRARRAAQPGWTEEALRAPCPGALALAPSSSEVAGARALPAAERAALAERLGADELARRLSTEGPGQEGALAVASMADGADALARLEPALRALIGATRAHVDLAIGAHAALVARACAEPAEVARLLRAGAAALAASELAQGRDAKASLEQVGAPGAPERRAAADAGVAAIHASAVEGGQLVPAIGRAVDIGLREQLGDDLPGWRALGDDLALRACRAKDGVQPRSAALEPLTRGWPGRHVALRREGRLPARALPSWSEWDGVRLQTGAALLLAASVDPDALLAFLGDRENAPAAATLVRAGQATWALEAAAGLSVLVARLEPARTAALEAVLRARVLEVPIDGERRCDSLALHEAHAALLEAAGPVAGLPAALELCEARLEQAHDQHALYGAMRAAHRLGAAALVLAASCLRRVRERGRPAALRWRARLALETVRQVAQHAPVVDPGPWIVAADEHLVAALADPSEDEALRATLRADLDLVLPPERTQALRREGALPRVEVVPWPDVPGARSGSGNAIQDAGEELARKALPDDLLALLERVAARGDVDDADLGRALTVFDVAPRIAKRRAADGARLEPAVRRFLDDPRDLAGPRGRSYHLRMEALNGWSRLLDALPQAKPEERRAWTDAFERALAAAPTASHYQHLGPHAAVVVARAARRMLATDAVPTFGPWLLARIEDRARPGLERMHARRALDGLGDPASQVAGDALLLRILGDPTEDAALRREAHPFVAPRRGKEVAALIEQGLLDLGPPPPIADLQVAMQGGYMLHEQAATEAAGRAHPARLVASLARLELEHLLGALVILPRVLPRAPEVAPAAEAALLELVADPRGLEVKKEGSRERFLARDLAIAALRGLVDRRPPPERRASLARALRASLRLDAVARALYAVHTDRGEQSRARAEAGAASWRLLVNALVEASAPDAVLDVARDVAATAPPGERLAALDALCWLVARAAPKDRPAAEAARDAALARLVADGFASATGLEGLLIIQDWATERPPQPRFAWVGPSA